jgi:uncharacterized protein
MKRIIFIITVVLLFSASGLIFWAGLSPKTFSDFFVAHPVVSQIGILNNLPLDLNLATSSEAVTSLSGQVTINNNSWGVEIAKNEQSRTLGLSNRRTLYHNKGMLFVFDTMTVRNFWMKDMLISIDMIFFDNNWRIVKIESDLSPTTFPKVFGNDIKSQYVLEINAGEAAIYSLAVGDQAIFINK